MLGCQDNRDRRVCRAQGWEHKHTWSHCSQISSSFTFLTFSFQGVKGEPGSGGDKVRNLDQLFLWLVCHVTFSVVIFTMRSVSPFCRERQERAGSKEPEDQR